MRHSLLLLGVIAALAIGAPAYSQYIYLDSNLDGLNSATDVLTSSSTAVRVYLDTNHDQSGAVENCIDGVNPFDFASIDMVFHQAGSGSVTYNSSNPFTLGPALSSGGFTLLNTFTVAGSDAGVGYNGPNYLSPGLYLIGTLNVAVTGTPVLSFIGMSSNPSIPSFGTGFGSHCEGTDNPNTITLGIDFEDGFGTRSGTPTEATTWGKIKQLYR